MRKTILILAAACLWGLLAPLAIAKDRSADLERAHSSGRPKTDSIARTAELLETRSVSKGHWAANEVDLQSERIEFDLEKSVLQRSEITDEHGLFKISGLYLACITKPAIKKSLHSLYSALKILISPFQYLPCININSANENFEVCMFNSITSKSKHSTKSYGTYQKLFNFDNVKEKNMKKQAFFPMNFQNGSLCEDLNKPLTSEIRFVCKSQNLVLIDVINMVCHKIFVFGTRFVCPILDHIKNEKTTRTSCSFVSESRKTDMQFESKEWKDFQSALEMINVDDIDVLPFHYINSNHAINPNTIFNLMHINIFGSDASEMNIKRENFEDDARIEESSSIAFDVKVPINQAAKKSIIPYLNLRKK